MSATFRFARLVSVLLVPVLLAAPASVGAQTPQTVDWPLFGNDYANSRFQDVDQINPSNVQGLRPAWVFHTGVLEDKASLEVSPIVVGGTMFVTSGLDDLFALNPTDGHLKWVYHAIADGMPDPDKISLCCGRANRGVAVDDGRVFLARLDTVLVALDADTGHVLWRTPVVSPRGDYSMTMAPQVVDGLVIVGVSGGEFEVRGQVIAFDASTGQEAWRFFTTTPATWAGSSWKHGAGTLWQTPPVDRDLGLIYVNTGNPGPDLNGIHRLGKNLYTDSIVALNVHTGTVRWAFQEVHHDLWDYDSAQPALLFDLTRNGSTVPALGHCSKNGNYYILDRRTGSPIYPVTEVPVPSLKPAWQHPWPTQPKSAVEPLTPLTLDSVPSGFKGAPQYTPPSTDDHVIIQPGADGGCEFPPGAYSPRTKFVYYGTRYEPSTFVTSPNNTEDIGSAFEEKIPGVVDYGIFGATDTTTGKVAWKIRVTEPAKSGVLVAGDLVFFGESNGRFDAVDAQTGDVLWIFDGTNVPHGGGADAAPVAYVAGGREFIVNAFGGNTADREFTTSPVGDAIVAFSLP